MARVARALLATATVMLAGALAVADQGRLVLARGYGQADVEADGFFTQLERGLREAARESEWPVYDLFERHR